MKYSDILLCILCCYMLIDMCVRGYYMIRYGAHVCFFDVIMAVFDKGLEKDLDCFDNSDMD